MPVAEDCRFWEFSLDSLFLLHFPGHEILNWACQQCTSLFGRHGCIIFSFSDIFLCIFLQEKEHALCSEKTLKLRYFCLRCYDTYPCTFSSVTPKFKLIVESQLMILFYTTRRLLPKFVLWEFNYLVICNRRYCSWVITIRCVIHSIRRFLNRTQVLLVAQFLSQRRCSFLR